MEESNTPGYLFDEQWLYLNAIRQAKGIAEKNTPTYEQSLQWAVDADPILLPLDSDLAQSFQSAVVRLYTQRAQAREQEVIQVIEEDISRLQGEMSRAKPNEQEAIESEITKLMKARDSVHKTNWTETQSILQDAGYYQDSRQLPLSGKGQGYKEFRIDNTRRLRIRVLHPDPAEARSGVDLIYEAYWDREMNNATKTKLFVRIAALQYKMWDGKAIYTSQEKRVREQLQRMQQAFCKNGFCESIKGKSPENGRYRLPCCCVFLRPTDKKQTKNGWSLSHAWHVPACVVSKKFVSTPAGYEALYSKDIRSQSVTQRAFEELYNSGMLGSAWMPESKLRKLYAEIGIFDSVENITVHAQEYSVSTASRR
jgi:hypothetical protein